MIAHKNQKRPTKLEQLRIDAVMKGGCYVSHIRRALGLAVPTSGVVEYQHITEGRKRLGHLYGYPLHDWYHRGIVPDPCTTADEARALYGASIADGLGANTIGDLGLTEREIWQSLQRAIGQSDELPTSKIFPRREVA